MLRINFPTSLQKLKRCRLDTVRLVILQPRMFWEIIIATSKVVQLFSAIYLWSAFTNSSFVSCNYSSKYKFWLIFYRWKMWVSVAGKWQASILSLLAIQRLFVLVFISRNIAIYRNWSNFKLDNESAQVPIKCDSGTKHEVKNHTREDKISYIVHDHLFIEWLLVITALCQAFSVYFMLSFCVDM